MRCTEDAIEAGEEGEDEYMNEHTESEVLQIIGLIERLETMLGRWRRLTGDREVRSESHRSARSPTSSSQSLGQTTEASP